MARPVYPPDDYRCPYLHRCPHLEYLSTSWVLSNYDRYDGQYREHLRIVDLFQKELGEAEDRIKALEKEVAELRAKNIELHRRQFKPGRKKGSPPPSPVDGVNEEDRAVSGKKKRGAPFGHPGWSRKKPNRIDRIEHVAAPSVCPHCSMEDIAGTEVRDEHIQEDIVLVPKTVATKYIHETSYCPRCKRNVSRAGKGEMPGSPIGPVAKSTASFLRYRIGISYRNVQELFAVLFGMKLVPASLVGFDRQAVRRGRPLYDDLREKVRASPVVHADETSWRNDGEGHWAWYAGNPDLAFFHIDRSRSGDVAEGILGKRFGGTLVTDRYAAYARANAVDWQTCLAHLIRRAKELLRELEGVPAPHRDMRSVAFLTGVADIFTRACREGSGLTERSPEKATRLEKSLAGELAALCTAKLGFKDAETLRASLIGKDNSRLFTFLRIPGVPPTNNQAEQSIRFMVIFRKILFGTRSQQGLVTHSVLPSLIRTAERQGKHPREFLHTLLTGDTATAQRALYRNTC